MTGPTSNSAGAPSGRFLKNIPGLYLCLFDQGTVKVGRAANAKARLADHKAAGARFGIGVIKTDIVPCDSENIGERLLLKWCTDNSKSKACNEWFSGVDYDQCLAQARLISVSLMGPHQPKNKKESAINALFESWKAPMTKEAEVYCIARKMMLDRGIPENLIECFDYLHSASERVRSAMRIGSAMPTWFDELNCFEFWENELLMDEGHLSVELLRAAADAIAVLEGVQA